MRPVELCDLCAHQGQGITPQEDPLCHRVCSLEERLLEAQRQMAKAQDAAAAYERRALDAEAALKEAAEDLARDEVRILRGSCEVQLTGHHSEVLDALSQVIFAEQVANIKAIKSEKDDALLYNEELKAKLAAAAAEIEELRKDSGAAGEKTSAEPYGDGLQGITKEVVLRKSAAESAAAELEEEDMVRLILGFPGAAPYAERWRLQVLIGADNSINEDDGRSMAAAKEMAMAASEAEMDIAHREFASAKDGMDAQLRELEHNIREKEALIEALSQNEAQQRELSSAYEARLKALEAEVAQREAKVTRA